MPERWEWTKFKPLELPRLQPQSHDIAFEIHISPSPASAFVFIVSEHIRSIIAGRTRKRSKRERKSPRDDPERLTLPERDGDGGARCPQHERWERLMTFGDVGKLLRTTECSEIVHFGRFYFMDALSIMSIFVASNVTASGKRACMRKKRRRITIFRLPTIGKSAI